MDDQTLTYRAEIARRLKAARWLAGSLQPNDRGRAGWEVVAITADELAARPGMAENQMTASKIGSIERLERHTTPMELEVLARALGFPRDWFSRNDPTATRQDALSLLRSALADLGAELAPSPREGEADGGEPGR